MEIMWSTSTGADVMKRIAAPMHFYVVHPRAGRLSGHLRDLEVAFRPQARAR